MILWLLHRFAAFRELEAQLYDAAKDAQTSREKITKLESLVSSEAAQWHALEARCADSERAYAIASDTVADKILEIQRENAAKIQAIERVKDLEADNLRLRDDLQLAQNQRVIATETVADWLAQERFGRKIFSHAPTLPAEAPPVEQIPRGVHGRTVVEEQTKAFYQQLASQDPKRMVQTAIANLQGQ